MEQCGLACHIILFLAGLAYAFFLVAPLIPFAQEEHLSVVDAVRTSVDQQITVLSTSVVALFLATPLLYCAVNVLRVPRIDAPLTDEHTLFPTSNGDIYDVDVAEVNDMLANRSVSPKKSKN